MEEPYIQHLVCGHSLVTELYCNSSLCFVNKMLIWHVEVITLTSTTPSSKITVLKSILCYGMLAITDNSLIRRVFEAVPIIWIMLPASLVIPKILGSWHMEECKKLCNKILITFVKQCNYGYGHCNYRIIACNYVCYYTYNYECNYVCNCTFTKEYVNKFV